MRSGLGGDDLYLRGAETLLASWEEYARGATGATVRRWPGVAAAAFPNEPERAVHNNALLERGLTAGDRDEAIGAMEGACAAAGVTRFAAWVHESDQPMRGDLERRGYRLDESTRATGMALDDIRLPRPKVELGPPDWLEYPRILGCRRASSWCRSRCLPRPRRARRWAERRDRDRLRPPRRLRGLRRHDLEHARRHGLGTALTTLQVHDALARGCETASLQSTAMAEHIYTAVGFRDLGRILEYVR